MMLADFLTPLDKDIFLPELLSDERWGRDIQYHFEDSFPLLEDIHIAIIGVEESRGCDANSGSNTAPDTIRKQLYRLARFDYNLKIADLGNIKAGATLQDTYVATLSICSELRELGIIPILLGGTKDLSFGQFLSYTRAKKPVNVTLLSKEIDWHENDTESTLYKIFTHESNVLFNYTHLGYQTHFTAHNTLELLDKLDFEYFRLSQLREEQGDAFCVMRNSDMVSFSMDSVRYADAPGIEHPTPNGLMGEEICLLARYAGLSTRVNSFGIYDLNPAYDQRDISSQLAAQIIWYFVDGFYHRMHEKLAENAADYLKYITSNDTFNEDIVFWKSPRTNNWWVQVPVSSAIGKMHFDNHVLLPCTYNDYERTLNGDLPERWIKAFHKLN